MPIYEFQCRQCDTRFETLVRISDVPACPQCHSEELQKLISAHAIGSGAPDTPCGSAPCSPIPACGMGGCGSG
ncbi:MAG: zinc ribbon domain-containing protein [Mariprofundaceae bacterium]|nr:zinc ribbon domain-containing protein [Mariprofundaceae bacterium]